MVTGNIKNCDKYYVLNKYFKDVFEYLKNVRKDDEKYVISEGNAWVNAPVVRDTSADIFEAHRKFIDIHYILSGSEVFGYSDVERLETIEEYGEEKDYELLKGKGSQIDLAEGDFIIVFPEDAHIPTMEIDESKEVIRVVAKVRTSLED